MYPASVARSGGRQGSPGGASAGHGGNDACLDAAAAFEEVDAVGDVDDAGENADAAEEEEENPPPLLLPSPLATRASASATSAVVSRA